MSHPFRDVHLGSATASLVQHAVLVNQAAIVTDRYRDTPPPSVLRRD